ncbi:hypothetical protein IMCC12053_874 [Celeribacter marinus]|uniref:Uncharacterized protein n=1 Tax=Celeribacter marinus TaxID=1397108 RepID=A0A0N9ZN50_9RHOB|nr:hypothetical protein IMCC12053_874 [Celeribacter marinus]
MAVDRTGLKNQPPDMKKPRSRAGLLRLCGACQFVLARYSIASN